MVNQSEVRRKDNIICKWQNFNEIFTDLLIIALTATAITLTYGQFHFKTVTENYADKDTIILIVVNYLG